MRKGQGLRQYFYEYIFHQATGRAREQTGQIIPISHARSLRARVDELLAPNATAMADPGLKVSVFLTALDTALGEHLPGYEPQFGDHSPTDPVYVRLQDRFMFLVGIGTGPSARPALPISPYDPRWALRSTIRHGGTALAYLPDQTITRVTGGVVAGLDAAGNGSMMLWKITPDGQADQAGPAMTDEDAAGLSVLMDMMSPREYQHVRGWVLDGGRDPRTGRIDPGRFMSTSAIARSLALLGELQASGMPYEVLRDQRPGQIRARVLGTGISVRLTDSRDAEHYAGARVYDNGTVIRYATNLKEPGRGGRPISYSPTPEDAVRLLRYALGRPVPRTDVPGGVVGRPDPAHIEQTWDRAGRAYVPVRVPGSYHLGKASMSVAGDHPPSEAGPGGKVLVRRDAGDRSLPDYFVDADAAWTYLDAAVSSARANLAAALDVEGMLELHATWEASAGSDGSEAPEFSGDPEIGAIQRSYWDVLTGARSLLLRPGASEEEYRRRLEAALETGDLHEPDLGELGVGELDLGGLAYLGEAAEKIRAHAQDTIEELIGTTDPVPRLDEEGEFVEQRFDPVRVAKYMTSPTGLWGNLDSLAAALRRAEVAPGEMLGSGFGHDRFTDRLIRFDEATAVPLAGHQDAFLARVGDVVTDAIGRNGALVGNVAIDERGVIEWTADRVHRDGSLTAVRGEIGQVFAPGAWGQIVTRFASGDNAMIVPGYEARIRAQRPGQSLSVEERTLLRGYEQLLAERISHQIADDLTSGRSEVGEGASLNGLYARVYGTRHPVDYIERSPGYDAAGETPGSWTASILATEARRVRYPNSIRDGSTVHAEFAAQTGRQDPADDNHFDAWRLTGGRNMALLTGPDQNGRLAPAGYFDPVMTAANTNQGLVRYLTADAHVAPDGSIIPGNPDTVTGSRAPLMARTELDTLRFDPFDRQQMTATTLMQASTITEPVATAMMTFGGWTADDPIVVSARFAAAQQIRGADGSRRGLIVGDKVSDLHGNKGVISLIVDTDMDEQEARTQGIEREVAWFRANPDMDVVLSPFSLISRRNAGSGRELMNAATSDLHNPDAGGTVAGGVGRMRFVVTHKAVDDNTRVYDDDALAAGAGRQASAQLAWALCAQDCPAIMSEFYGHNTGAEATLREYLLVVGLDMEADGTLRVVGRTPGTNHVGHDAVDERPDRRLFEMPDLVTTTNGRLDTRAMRGRFGALIGDRGGDLEIPFPLTYPTGEQTEQASAVTWKLPVLSSHLRSGQEFDDGTTVAHDYTSRYLDIHEAACRYRHLASRLAHEPLTANGQDALQAQMGQAHTRAQRALESIIADVEHRVFTGRRNIFKNTVMSARLPDSATAVWTSDPRLDIDQIAMNSAMADSLGLVAGDHALVWRDPVLRDAGVKYLRVTSDDRLTGVAINPVLAKGFEGDFDGDAVAVVALHSKAARAEAQSKLTVQANLLDIGSPSARSTYPFVTHVSLDTRVSLSQHRALREQLAQLSGNANLTEHGAGSEPPETTRARRDHLTGELSEFYRAAQRSQFGAALSFASPAEHIDSMRRVCVDTGAKGDEKKLAAYARNLGFDINSGQDLGEPGITAADQLASMYATAVKSHGTGLAGAFSQRAVRALRNADVLREVLELTAPVTQSILQAKHDADEARHKYRMLAGAGRDLWRGRLLELDAGEWTVRYEDGEPVQATGEDWTHRFVEFYQSPAGFNVHINPEHVRRVAQKLTDPATGLIRNLEDHPALAGTVMDRMAYGEDKTSLHDLIQAAARRENVFDGHHNERFASAATRRQRDLTTRQLDIVEPGTQAQTPAGVPAGRIGPEVVKPDVTADHTRGARPRGAARRSIHAVALPAPAQPAPAWEAAVPVEESFDVGLGG